MEKVHTFVPTALWMAIFLEELYTFLPPFDQWRVSKGDYSMSKQSFAGHVIAGFVALLLLPREYTNTSSLGPRIKRHTERG